MKKQSIVFYFLILVLSSHSFSQYFQDTTIYGTWIMTKPYFGRVIIGADNVVIDMRGNLIIGNGSGYGININFKNNVTIRSGRLGGGGGVTSGRIEGFISGIYIQGGNAATIDNIDLVDNKGDGLFIEGNARCFGVHYCDASSNDGAGFSIKNSSGTISNCRSNRNEKDGFDQNGGSIINAVNYYACNANNNLINGFENDKSTGGFRYEYCYSTYNTNHNFSFTDGASNGIFRDCIAAYSKEDGFHFNSGAGYNKVYDSRAFNNGNGDDGDRNWDDKVGTNTAIPLIPN